MKKLKLSLIIAIVVLLILIISTIVLNQTGIIRRIADNINKEEIKKEITCQVYSHVNGKTAILVIAEDTENGIDKIVYPDNEMTLSCNGKTKVAFDYNTDITGKDSLTFKAINTQGEEIEKTILINDQFYLDLIGYSFVNETETQKVMTVDYKEGTTTKQYKIGETENWTNYIGTIRLDDYQILETLGQENKETNVYLRQIDQMGYEIRTKVKYTIDESTTYKQEDTVIEGESILACVENNTLESGNYIFKVTGKIEEQNEEGENVTKTETIEYPVELYNYDGNANYITNNINVVGGSPYTGMGKLNSEKRMLILKYNGDLTINEGVTITPTGTSESINGATYLCTKKGMLIYCAGTLTNNGTITMTAKGTVNQEGENVYLYKNEDNTYEYIPAIGGAGGAGIGISTRRRTNWKCRNYRNRKKNRRRRISVQLVVRVLLLNLDLDLLEHHTLVDQAVEELILIMNTIKQPMAAKMEVMEEMDQVENRILLVQVAELETQVEVKATVVQVLEILEQEDYL